MGDEIKVLHPKATKDGVQIPYVLSYLKSEPVKFVDVSPIEALRIAEELTRAARMRLSSDSSLAEDTP